ncbi:MAG: UDP-N-acetylmuramoyl-L-alanyl-D-glutamate--2,6-diaminopimelate ligase [Arsenophonus sp.]
MENRNLRYLLYLLGVNAPDKALREITLDSRNVTKGDLFLAVRGNKTDGRKYIYQAISQGASAIISEAQEEIESGTIKYIDNVPVVYINDLNNKLSFLAGEFYQHPAERLLLIGVTGTNGKTTITHLIAQWTKALGEVSAVMGTIGNGILGQISPSKNTTGSAIDVQAELKSFLDKNVTLVAMEISSCGLVQCRVAAIHFTAAVFSNLSYDHLDYHGDIQNYEKAKWLLFSINKSDKKIINVDDNTGLKWIERFTDACAVSIRNNIPIDWKGFFVLVEKISYYDCGSIIYFNSSWGSGFIKSTLIGEFNVSNIMLAMATILMIGYSFDDVVSASVALQPICGRMEVFKSPGHPTVIVDYAHTPDALEKALTATSLHSNGKIWSIFGCGGDRDKIKRALMGSIAEQYADFVVITDDNPRNEDSKSIINDILSGFIDSSRVITIIGRLEAITTAIINANVDDIILITGKGHEDYQIIGDSCLKYSDRITVAQLLGVPL